MIILMIVPGSGFGFYSDIDPFHSSIPSTGRQLAKPTAKSKVVMKLESSILFVDPRFEYYNNPSSITMESQVL